MRDLNLRKRKANGRGQPAPNLTRKRVRLHTEDSVFNRGRRPGKLRWMKLNCADARTFSLDLLRIHTAGSEAELEAQSARLAARLPMQWLAGLLSEHVALRRWQLREARPDDSGLTARERQVLARLARGETDAAAARALGIATRTASKHVESILRKLGVETRTAAVRQSAGPRG